MSEEEHHKIIRGVLLNRRQREAQMDPARARLFEEDRKRFDEGLTDPTKEYLQSQKERP